MPTIEIVSIGCENIPELPSFTSFALKVEKELKSHRALFQPEFNQVTGVIVHLGNKNLESREYSAWFGGDLIDWDDSEIVIPPIDPNSDREQWWGEDQSTIFRFKSEVIPELKELLELLIKSSSIGRCYFTTDYQFGPSEANVMERKTLAIQEFFEVHEKIGFRWNSLYDLCVNSVS